MNVFTPFRLLMLAALCTGSALQAQPASAPDAAPVVVQTLPGAMVSRIAAAHRPAGASLEQTLLAILRANPHAFMGGNINLLAQGANLTIPTAADIQAIPAEEARRTIQQQHADFARHGQALARKVVPASASAVAAVTPASVAGVAGVADPGSQAGSAMTAAMAAPEASASAAMATVATVAASATAVPEASPASSTSSATQPVASASSTDSTTSQAQPDTDSMRSSLSLIGSIAVILGLLLWGFLRARRKREEELERLQAEAEAEPRIRPAAEALARAMEDSVEIPPGDLAPSATHTPDEAPLTASCATAVSAPSAAPATAAVATTAADAATQPSSSPSSDDGAAEDLSSLRVDLDDFTSSADDEAPARKPLAFDFSGVSLDVVDPDAPAIPTEAALQTKLALAREFLAIEDLDGARVLAQEVARHGSAAQQAEAAALLQRLDAKGQA